jgi:cytochrome b pre-mRNA-processing protein 3
MVLGQLFGNRSRDDVVRSLYGVLVAQARRPWFYTEGGVPDTLDGRFDILVAHAFLLMRRLGRVEGDNARDAKALSQAVFDLMFTDLDHNLRELGVGDMSVGKKVKQMAKAFYGRVSAYDAALEDGEPTLAGALARNLYRGSPPTPETAPHMAAYLVRQARHLDGIAWDALSNGKLDMVQPQGAE